MPEQQEYFYGTGRRKTAVARVKLLPGSGNVLINGKPLAEVITSERLKAAVLQPLQVAGALDRFNAVVTVEGGGVNGQAGAISHGIARALAKMDENLKTTLRKYKLLTRDARAKERKKYGLRRARKAKQYTKR